MVVHGDEKCREQRNQADLDKLLPFICQGGERRRWVLGRVVALMNVPEPVDFVAGPVADER